MQAIKIISFIILSLETIILLVNTYDVLKDTYISDKTSKEKFRLYLSILLSKTILVHKFILELLKLLGFALLIIVAIVGVFMIWGLIFFHKEMLG